MSTVTSRGQVTIPKRVRDQLGIGPGSEVDFRVTANGEIHLTAEREQMASAKSDDRFARILGIAGPGPTTDDLMALLRGED